MHIRKLNNVLRTLNFPVYQTNIRVYCQVDLGETTRNLRTPPADEPNYDETSYYFENGLRKVYPYHFTFASYTKFRWIGQNLLDVYAKEFCARPVSEYERCLRNGIFTVNHGRVDADYIIKVNDLLLNTLRRHEVPVTDAPVRVLHTDDDTVAVDKPSSIPVHPCGRYRHNSVQFILAKEHGIRNLRPLHRIDRLTSGLVLFGRTVERARLMFEQLRTRQVEKEYICRVQGHFPQGVIECHEPMDVIWRKVGVSKVSSTGKPCSTEFLVLSRSGASSVVLCKPRTGRTHQIRVHLQYLGYPILNDPIYNHSAFGTNKGKGGVTEVTDEELLKGLHQVLSVDSDVEVKGLCSQRKEDPLHKEGVVSCSASPKHLPGTNSEVCREDYGFKPHLNTFDKNCYECKVRCPDPKPKELIMFLHAFKYSGPGWQFETKMPDWADPDWTDTEDSPLD